MLKTAWFEKFHVDFSSFTNDRQRPGIVKMLLKVLGEPGLVFAFLMRAQQAFEENGRMRSARVVHLINLQITGAEVGHNCQVGPGIVVKHPLGLLLGGGSVIGRNCIFLRNVTLGARYPDVESDVENLYPKIGDDCTLGTGATLLGPIVIGDRVKVGAHSLVLHDIPPGVTAVGVPARVVP